MTNNNDTLSTPRDLSKTHKRAYIVSIRNKESGADHIFYVKNEWEAQGHKDGDKQHPENATTYYPVMVTNAHYDTIG